MRCARPAALLLAFLLAGCQYLKDRAADFLDPYRIGVGVGTAVGVRTRQLGLVDTGLMIGVKPRATSLGWRYGTPAILMDGDPRIDADQAEVIKTTSLIGLDYAHGSYQSARNSAALLPGLLSWVDATPAGSEWVVPETGDLFADRHWLWSATAFGEDRYQQVHAFDLEGEIALLAYYDVGFSPGEVVDFLLGWFLLDIAKDDGRF